jgi:PAS domain S-box-containing protein
MEAALIRASDEWRQTFDATRDLIMLTDGAGRILRANRAVPAFLGLAFREILGSDAVTVFGKVDLPPEGHPLTRNLAGGQRQEAELHLVERGRWMQATADPVHGRAGEIHGAVFTLRDVTERRRAELENRNLQHQLGQMQKMDSIGRLAGGIAHDFNNMLSIMLGYCETAKYRLEPGHPAGEPLETVMNAAEKAAELTQQLLAFSRKQVLTMRLLDLNRVVRQMTRLLGRIVRADIRFELRLAPELGRVLGDRSQIEQVLLNLVVNARDAMPEGGVLSIETAEAVFRPDAPAPCPCVDPGPYVMLIVRDTGVGMPEEVRERVFEPFFTTKEEGKGTGLGLATVYGIVRQHGGYIGVESAPGKGTSFQVCLPASDAEPDEEFLAEAAAALHGSEGILVVDDDKTVRAMLADSLTDFGYRVSAAGSAEEALEILARQGTKIDLLFSDVILPGMSGRQLADRALAADPRLAVILTSGCSDGADDAEERRRLNRPEVEFLPKPLQPSRFLKTIRERLDRVC